MIAIEKTLRIVGIQKINLRDTELSITNSLGFYLAEEIISPSVL